MKICSRQICFLLIAYSAASKLLTYPTIVAHYGGADSLYIVAVQFIIQCAVIWSISFFCSKYQGTFFSLLKSNFGSVAARIIFGLFGVYFLLATVMPLFEQKVYVHTIFYDTVPSLTVFLPFFFFSLYAGAKKFTNIGRCADLCLPVFIVCMILIFSMSFSEIEFSAFLPVLKTPLDKLATGGFITFSRFIEPAFMLFFMGRFEYKKGDALKFTLSYALAGLIVLLLVGAYYGIYADLVTSRQFAISKVSLFFSPLQVLGRLDLIVLYTIEVVMLFALVLNIQLSVQCFSECFSFEKIELISLIVNAILCLIVVVFNYNYSAIEKIYGSGFWALTLLFSTLIPVLCWTLRRKNV